MRRGCGIAFGLLFLLLVSCEQKQGRTPRKEASQVSVSDPNGLQALKLLANSDGVIGMGSCPHPISLQNISVVGLDSKIISSCTVCDNSSCNISDSDAIKNKAFIDSCHAQGNLALYCNPCQIGCGNITPSQTTTQHASSVSTSTSLSTKNGLIDTTKTYKLTTQYQASKNKCLEGNDPSSNVHGGNLFLDDCKNVSGQIWQLSPSGDNQSYRLTTQFQASKNKCLEANDPSSPYHGGSSFLDNCQNVTGQQWVLRPSGDNKVFKLSTLFQDSSNKCLEGNDPSSSVQGGNVFMDTCQNVTGQNWILTPAN